MSSPQRPSRVQPGGAVPQPLAPQAQPAWGQPVPGGPAPMPGPAPAPAADPNMPRRAGPRAQAPAVGANWVQPPPQPVPVAPQPGPAGAPAEPVEPEEVRTWVSFGALLGLASLVLCCMPLGALGMLFPFRAMRNLDAIPDPEERARLRKLALVALGLCGGSAVLSVFGYTFALLAGCN